MEEFHYIDVSFYASIKHIGAKIIVKVEAGENDSLRSLVENAIREKLQLQLWQASLHLSPSDAVYIGAITALQQKLESVSDRFSCGDLIFEDDDPLSKAVVQKKNLTCETRIERGTTTIENGL
eukprot:CAMPEP_0113400332 /NCGR_PEP_ID=MMETSP0013_2-20120614/16062_1 /TAXON_ID=2843 ORGANISM="Skeletonema costatum, Strain 1716" /NCGR_SAMPLE_ID=MMETSP0013_2 /ASSEMBLY_ACC=CAM_ASM_000158 /LENGTH=122 /DNA_ID=CAMNT_0000285385 /DNA_START=246 /DNA_END=615 /DNA_ORIENTATION=- /assembly_acc=CAM_ASM_000158